MNPKILLLALTAAFLSSCTTSYKTGQTPDDVYYSPVKPQEEYVKTETDKEDQPTYQNNDPSTATQDYEDQYLRMKVRNRYRWSDLDDPYYYSRRYNFSSYNCCCFGNPWTPSSYWNNHFNPYYNSYIIINPKASLTYTSPRTFNLNSYNNNALTNSNYSNPKIRNTGSSSSGSSNNNNTFTAPRNNTSNNESNSGKILREIFKPSNTNNNSSSTNTNNNNSSSSSSSSSSSTPSTPAPVRKF